MSLFEDIMYAPSPELQELSENIKEQLRKMETGNSYDFVSREDDIDYVRIVKEAPAKTPFILVEERDRLSGRPKHWSLFIHNDVLNHPALVNFFGGWGLNEISYGGSSKKLYSYRVFGGDGKFPGYTKQFLEFIRRRINPKNIRTSVRYEGV